MALVKSGVYVQTVKDIFTQTVYTGGNVNFTLATYKIALWNSAMVDGIAPLNFSAVANGWANTNEVSGTGWAAGGVLLSAAAAGAATTSPTLTEGTAGSIRYDMLDISVASTTLNTGGGPYGCIIYADPVTAPNADPMLVAVNFLGSYPTNNGTFGITWSGTGIFEIDLTP